jgi:hypothetical protein
MLNKKVLNAFQLPIFSSTKSVAENHPVVGGVPVMLSSVVTP